MILEKPYNGFQYSEKQRIKNASITKRKRQISQLTKILMRRLLNYNSYFTDNNDSSKLKKKKEETGAKYWT